MDGKAAAEVRIAAMAGRRVSRNACAGCGLYTCFGNSGYDKQLEPHQQTHVDKWREYIVGQIAAEKQTSQARWQKLRD